MYFVLRDENVKRRHLGEHQSVILPNKKMFSISWSRQKRPQSNQSAKKPIFGQYGAMKFAPFKCHYWVMPAHWRRQSTHRRFTNAFFLNSERWRSIVKELINDILDIARIESGPTLCCMSKKINPV